MNTEHLKALLDIVDAGSLTAAAEKRGYSVSGISRMVSSLEEEFGFRLLIRNRDGVTPTEDLKRLLPSIRKVLFHQDSLLQQAAQIRSAETGQITLGTSYSCFFPKIRSCIDIFRKRYPDVSFRLHSGYTNELLDQLLDHRMDICLVSHRDGPYEWSALQEDELIAWVPDQGHFHDLKAVSLTEFARNPFIDIYQDREVDTNLLLKEQGIEPPVKLYAVDSYSAFCMVEAGLGITLNNRLNCVYQSSGVKQLPLDPVCKAMAGIACLKDMTPAASRFLKVMEGVFRN